jgi:hypothetical protein
MIGAALLLLLILALAPALAVLDQCDTDTAAALPCACDFGVDCAAGEFCSSVTRECVEESCHRILILARNRSSHILRAPNYVLTQICVVPDEIDVQVGTMVIERHADTPLDEQVGIERPDGAPGKYRLFTVSPGAVLELGAFVVVVLLWLLWLLWLSPLPLL